MSTKKLQIINSITTTDDTLTQSGVAADAKAVGDNLAEIATKFDDYYLKSEANTLHTEIKDYVDTEVAALVNSAPETLDTIGELAVALQENKDVISALNTSITKKTDKNDTPFRFGIDENGNYGYIKVGADSVTPFKRVAKKAGNIVCGYHEKTLDCSQFEDRDILTVDNFYLMPTSFTVQNIRDNTVTSSEITLGTYNLHKTYNNYILRVQRDSIVGDTGVELNCDVYIIY